MRRISPSLVGRAAALGASAGLRSMTPLRLISAEEAPPGVPRWIHGTAVARALALAAIGEHVADKLPGVPSRLEAAPLAGRLVVGGLVGLWASRRARVGGWGGALLGVAVGAGAAALSAALGFRLRSTLVQKTGLPDPVVAVIEDAVAIQLGKLGTVPR